MSGQHGWVLPLLALLILFSSGSTSDCRALVALASLWLLAIQPHPSPRATQPERATSMDPAVRRLLRSFPIGDISPFSSDDDEQSRPTSPSSSIGSAHAEAFVQLQALRTADKLPQKRQPQQQAPVAQPQVQQQPQQPQPASGSPLTPLKWQTKLADRATAAVNLEAHYSLPPFTLFDLLADPFQHDKIFDAILSADAELLEDDGVRKKWRLDYQARWNFWKVSGVCENRLFMWTDRDCGTITFKLREPGFLKRYEGTWTIKPACGTTMAECYAALAGGSSSDALSRSSSTASLSRLPSPAASACGGSSCSTPRSIASSDSDGSSGGSLWSLLSSPAPGALAAAGSAAPLASVSATGAVPMFPGLTGAVAAIARMQAELHDSVSITVNNTRTNFANSAAAMQALSHKAIGQGPFAGVLLGSSSAGSSSSSRIGAGRQQSQRRQRRPLPTASVILVESLTSPKITPPYPLNQALKVQSKGQISDMLEGLVAAAAAQLAVTPLQVV